MQFMLAGCGCLLQFSLRTFCSDFGEVTMTDDRATCVSERAGRWHVEDHRSCFDRDGDLRFADREVARPNPNAVSHRLVRSFIDVLALGALPDTNRLQSFCKPYGPSLLSGTYRVAQKLGSLLQIGCHPRRIPFAPNFCTIY